MAGSDELFRLVVEGVHEYAIVLLDPQGRVVSWNAGAEILSGYAAADVIGRSPDHVYPREALERGWPAQELDLARRRGRYEYDGWRVRKDGTQLWANVVITALYGPGGDLLGFSNIVRDQSMQKREHESLAY